MMQVPMCLAASMAAVGGSAYFEPLLFMAMDDIVDPWGLIWQVATFDQISLNFTP
jgi:hypothetical protein